MDREKKKWRDILHRLLDITLFLVNQNLAFCGHQEDESSLNRGNMFEMVEILSKYDPVLKEHLNEIKEEDTVKASVSYLTFYLTFHQKLKMNCPSKSCEGGSCNGYKDCTVFLYDIRQHTCHITH